MIWSKTLQSRGLASQLDLSATDSVSLQPLVNGWPEAPSDVIQTPAAAACFAVPHVAAVGLPVGSPSTGGPAVAINAAAAQSQYGVTGAGIRIGILSDSFNVQAGYASDVAGEWLNPGATILKEGPSSGNDEGRAMAEVIHQIAPGAQILFYTAFGGEADFANGVAALAAAGAQIIVDDVTYLDEPFFQDGGLVQKAAERAVAAGVNYFTAAGNEGTNYYQHTFQTIRTQLPGLANSLVAMNFGTAASPQSLQTLTVASGSTIKLDLQWDQPFANAANSLGMVLYDDANTIVGYAMRNVVGGNPDQILQFTNNTASTDFHLAIVVNGGGTVPGEIKYIAYGNGLQIDDVQAGSGSGSVFGHEAATGVNTVGAASWHQAAGATAVESFSSVGTASLLFDASGSRLAEPVAGGGVDFVAPDGGSTSVFGTFSGTSAAAPAAAATAALILQKNASLTPAQVTAILRQSAIPVSGPVGAAGAGLIQADAALALTSATRVEQSATGAAAGSSTVTPALPTVAGSAGMTMVASIGSLPSRGSTLNDLGRDPTAQREVFAAIPPASTPGGFIHPSVSGNASAILPNPDPSILGFIASVDHLIG